MIQIIGFDRTPCGRCPVAEICAAFPEDGTDAEKDAWLAKVDMWNQPCSLPESQPDMDGAE